jgi:serine/threonine-protein kinase PknG
VTSCDRPGCGGDLDQLGYCQRCLMPPRGTKGSTPVPPGGVRTEPEPPPGPARWTPHRRPPRTFGEDAWRGLSLITLPTITGPTPAEAVRSDLEVPEALRRCPNRACRQPVGLAHDGQPALLEGRCPYDGTPYSFVPRLQPGHLLGERYRVQGCIGLGGQGWVFLAHDERLDNRPVALKGLIDADDPARIDAAAAEKRFLIRLDHEDIVDIHDFVIDDPSHHGYLVMEYVPGHPLDSPKLAGRLTTGHVIGYLLRVLRAIQYLHDAGYLFCDLKPSNLMAYGSGVKLIDLGAVRDAGADGIGLYSAGYDAPELLASGPSIATDLYTVGRTLQDLVQLYAPDTDHPDHASLRLLVQRATHRDPALRFGSAAELADQLSGVLQELLSRHGAGRHPAGSLLFTRSSTLIDRGLGAVPPLDHWLTRAARTAAEEGGCRPLDTGLPLPGTTVAGLPEPAPDPRDPAAGFLTTSVSADPALALAQLASYRASSPELDLLGCRLQLRLGRLPEAAEALARATGTAPPDWRIDWHRGLVALAGGDTTAATAAFDSCRTTLPGEPAPRLALALCAEHRAGTEAELTALADDYLALWRTDDWCESAALGRARVLLRLDDRAGALAVLDEVRETSPHLRALRIAAVRAAAGRLATLPSAEDLGRAADRLRALDLDDREERRLAAEILEAGLATGDPQARPRLEAHYRAFAGWAVHEQAHTVLIDLANAVRPLTVR